jgi:hypothetical protein
VQACCIRGRTWSTARLLLRSAAGCRRTRQGTGDGSRQLPGRRRGSRARKSVQGRRFHLLRLSELLRDSEYTRHRTRGPDAVTRRRRRRRALRASGGGRADQDRRLRLRQDHRHSRPRPGDGSWTDHGRRLRIMGRAAAARPARVCLPGRQTGGRQTGARVCLPGRQTRARARPRPGGAPWAGWRVWRRFMDGPGRRRQGPPPGSIFRAFTPFFPRASLASHAPTPPHLSSLRVIVLHIMSLCALVICMHA